MRELIHFPGQLWFLVVNKRLNFCSHKCESVLIVLLNKTVVSVCQINI